MPFTDNPMMQGTRGMLGKTLVFKDYNGKTLVANRPRKRKVISEKQQGTVERFKDATHYAKRTMNKPEQKAIYARGINERQRSAYAVAHKDYLNPPTIEEIDINDYHGRAGELIRVRAFDDFMVASVTITIKDEQGNILETGSAQARGKRGLWRFTTTTGLTEPHGIVVIAEAKDVSGNTVKKEVVKNAGLNSLDDSNNQE